jgi:hypothetical protein
MVNPSAGPMGLETTGLATNWPARSKCGFGLRGKHVASLDVGSETFAGGGSSRSPT